MTHPISRREFLRNTTAAALTTTSLAGLASPAPARSTHAQDDAQPPFKISVAAWSMHRMHFAGQLPLIEFPRFVRQQCDLDGLELVNTMFASPTYDYLREVKQQADDHGVQILLIMCDREGDMASTDDALRRQSVRNHHKWIDGAAVLGCHSIRCNSGSGQPNDQDAIQRCADSFAQLVEYGDSNGINIIIENHGGLSSHAPSLVRLMELVNHPRFGTLPDFGNFPEGTDIYESVAQMMPFAKAVSAKCYDFDQHGNETRIDYPRMMQIVLDYDYHGYVGIEYEGDRLGELEGILACRDLLRRLQTDLA